MNKRHFLAILLVIILPLTLFSQESLLYVTVTDFDENPSPGDKIFFISKKTGEMYSEVSDENGKFQIKLPNGSQYEVKIKAFDQPMNYTSIEIEESDEDMEFEIGIMYELPKTYTLKNVHFNTDSDRLKPDSYESLNELAELLLLKKTLKIELAGHTDGDGDNEYNLNLSQKRADAVRNYLIKKGVLKERVTAVGYGEEQPIASNDTEEGKALNRRTEVRILER